MDTYWKSRTAMDFTAMEELIMTLALSQRIDTLAERYREAIASGSTWDQCMERTELERTLKLYTRFDHVTGYDTLIERIEAGH